MAQLYRHTNRHTHKHRAPKAHFNVGLVIRGFPKCYFWLHRRTRLRPRGAFIIVCCVVAFFRPIGVLMWRKDGTNKAGVRRSGFWRVGLLEAKARYLILLLLLLGTEGSFLLSVFYSVSQVCASGVWKPVTVRRGSRLLCNRLWDVRVLAMRCTSLTSTGAGTVHECTFSGGRCIHSYTHTHTERRVCGGCLLPVHFTRLI